MSWQVMTEAWDWIMIGVRGAPVLVTGALLLVQAVRRRSLVLTLLLITLVVWPLAGAGIHLLAGNHVWERFSELLARNDLWQLDEKDPLGKEVVLFGFWRDSLSGFMEHVQFLVNVVRGSLGLLTAYLVVQALGRSRARAPAGEASSG